MSLPDWRYGWAAWMLGHKHPWFDYRSFGPKNFAVRPGPPVPPPGQIPQPVKDWYLKTFAADIAALGKPPPPVQVPPPFSGVGLFTAHDPMCIERFDLQGKVDWIALKADGGDRAAPVVAGLLRSRGFRVYVWEAENMLGQTAVDRYGATAYIAQDEGPGQRVAAFNRASEGIRVPKALVSNLWASDWPQGWACLGEAYTGTNPSATPAAIEFEARKRGATEFVPVFSLYDGKSENPAVGRRITVAEYLTMWPDRKRWCGYLAENLDPGDL